MPIVLDGTTGIVSPALDSDSSLTVGPAVMDTPTGSAPLFAARAWVNFNGSGTVAIRASGNVSSITDNGTGDYTINFTTAMPDVNYVVTSLNRSPGVASGHATQVETYTTSSTSIVTFTTAGTNYDPTQVGVVVHR